MIDYVFFDKRPSEMFADYLRALGLAPEVEAGEETFEVRLPDDVDDSLTDRIEAEYDRLLDMNRDLYYAETEAGPENFSMAGITLFLKDGTTSMVDVTPEFLNRILDVMSYDELADFVAAVVARVEDPDARTFCQRVREGDVAFADAESANPAEDADGD